MKESRTTHLFQELEQLDKSKTSYQNFISKHKTASAYASLSDFLNDFIFHNPDITPTIIIQKSGLSATYVYHTLDGRRPHPSKYHLVAICIALGMNLRETQKALQLAGCAQLHPKDTIDPAIILCINQGCNDIHEVSEFLMENGVEDPFGV